MSIPLSLSLRRAGIASASLPRPQPTTLPTRGGCASGAKIRCAACRSREHDTRTVLSAAESYQGELSYGSLYVLAASLTLATLAMIGVALTIQ